MAAYYGTVPKRTLREVFRLIGREPSKEDDESVHVVVFDTYTEYFDAVQRISEAAYKRRENGDGADDSGTR